MINTRLTRLTAGLLFVAGVPLLAETKVSQEIETGVQSVDINNPEAKFQEYKEVPNGIIIENYRMDVDSDKYDMSLNINKVRQEDQSASLEYDRGGKLWLNAAYNQTPHLWSNTSRTLYTEEIPGVLILPDALQDYFQTNSGNNNTLWLNDMPSYMDAAHTQKLYTRSDKSSLNLGGAVAQGLSVDLNVSQEKKNGHQLHSFAMGRSAVIEFAKPVDQTVYDSSLALNYGSKGLNLGFTYGLNLFENDVQDLTWDNSKRLTDASGNQGRGDGTSRGRGSLQPDNLAHNAQFAAGVDLPVKSHLDAEVSYTLMKQNEELLPYTINSALGASTTTLPSNTADQQHRLWVQNYNLSNRILDSLKFGVNLRSEQLGNDSKEIQFDGHNFLDNNWLTDLDKTHRLAYRKLNLGAYADWSILRSLTLGADVNQETVNRTHREFEETDETTLTGRLNYVPVSWFKVYSRYVYADRQAKDFDLHHYFFDSTTPTEAQENQGIRRYDIAARVKNAGDIQVQTWKGPISVVLGGGLGHEKYKSGDGQLYNPYVAIDGDNQNKQYGLLETRSSSANMDILWDISKMIGVSAYYQVNLIKNTSRQNQNDVSPFDVLQDTGEDYTLVTNDRYDTVGLDVDLAPTQRTKVQLGYDLAYSRGAMDYKDLGSVVSTAQSLPETIISKQNYKIKGSVTASKDVTVSLGYLFEIYNVKDFANDNVPLIAGGDSGQTNILLGDSSQDYKAHVVTLIAKYKF
jgi:MtrB/PioB family decaheme-associated outer membrane protein